MRIEIATPMYGGQCHGAYHISIIEFISECSKQNISVSFNHTYNESLIQRARNNITSRFYFKSDADVLLFIDSDIRFSGKALLDMVLEDKDVIGAITPLKTVDFNKIVRYAVGQGSLENIDKLGNNYNFNTEITPEMKEKLISGESVEVDRIGTGVLAIKRNVIEEMAKVNTRYLDDGATVEDRERIDFFPVTIDYDENWKNKRMMSEDYNFCNNWRN